MMAKAKKKPQTRKVRKPTKQQMVFADKYIELGTIEKAAIAAGYSEKYANRGAYKLLDIVGIKQYIATRMEEIQKPTIAKAEEVLEFLTSVMRGEVPDQFGLDAPLSERRNAAVDLGKRYALFTDKKEFSGAVPVVLVDDVTE